MACKPGSVLGLRRWIAIPLGRLLPGASRDRPGRQCGSAFFGTANRPNGRPYLVLLRVGFAVPLPLPVARCALTAPFHPYRRPKPPAVYFLWHFPWGRPRRTLSGTLLPWSPDFPPSAATDRDRQRLSGHLAGRNMVRAAAGVKRSPTHLVTPGRQSAPWFPDRARRRNGPAGTDAERR
jgi:hypothetical protein